MSWPESTGFVNCGCDRKQMIDRIAYGGQLSKLILKSQLRLTWFDPTMMRD